MFWNTCMHTHIHTHTHTHTHPHSLTHTITHAPTHPRTHAPHAPTHPRTHAPTHPRTHAPTHAPTHTHLPIMHTKTIQTKHYKTNGIIYYDFGVMCTSQWLVASVSYVSEYSQTILQLDKMRMHSMLVR